MFGFLQFLIIKSINSGYIEFLVSGFFFFFVEFDVLLLCAVLFCSEIL